MDFNKHMVLKAGSGVCAATRVLISTVNAGDLSASQPPMPIEYGGHRIDLDAVREGRIFCI